MRNVFGGLVMRKKLLAIVMSLTMILVFMPVMAFAEEPGEDNVSKITYTPKANTITLYKGVDEIDDDGDTYFDVGNAYAFWNDEVVIEYNDGTPTETLYLDELENWDYVIDKNGEYVSLREFQQGTPWDVGDTYDIFLKAKGKIDTTNKITVQIEKNSYKAFSFTQSEKYLYVFEADSLGYDPATDEYVLQDANTVAYAGSEGDILSFTLDDGSKVEFEYGRIEGDPDYPRGWDGFVTTDASGNKSRLQREIMIQDKDLRWKKDSDGHYINNTAKLTYMGTVSDKPVVSYVGYQVWFDPNGGDVNANTGVPIGMSVKQSMPDNWLDIVQPSKSGYTFSGWYEKDPATGIIANDPFDFDTKIYKETFLYAKWEEAAVCEHNYVITITKEPTCTENGVKTYTCTECGDTRTETIPATGHQWNTTYTVDVPATESAAGSQSIHCAVCGTIKEGSSQVIPQLTPSTPAVPAEIVDLPAVKISKPAAAKKSVNVKWKKVNKKNLKKIQGIEIQVATDPAFTNIVKTATAGKKKTSKVIKGLSSKTKYYVRIRAYAADNHVSNWKVKSVKIR